MMRHVFLMELRQRFRRPQTWIYFLLLAAGTFLNIIAQAGAFGSASFGRRMLNGPYHVAEGALVFSIIGVLITAGYMGQCVFRDFRTGIHPLIFTTPVRRRDYLAGRFLGALTGNAFILMGWMVGILIGSAMPFLDAARFGPFLAAAYIRPYLIFMLPNLLFTAAIFFALPALTRKILPNYVAGITLFVGYLLSGLVVADLDNRLLAAMLDPFGLQTFQQYTRYWTIADQNTVMLGLDGYLLWNRLFWVAVGLVPLVLVFTRFRFQHPSEGRSWRRRRKPVATAPTEAPQPAIRPMALPAAAQSFRAADAFRQYVSLARTALVSTVRNIYFVAIVLAGLIFLVGSALFLDENFGTTIYPVTHRVVSALGGDFSLFMLIIITYYSGELVWRERDLDVQQIHDSLPVRNWMPFLAKFTALSITLVILLVVVMLYGIVVQTLLGYHNYELGVYVKELFGIQLIDLLLLAGLAFFVQAIVNHKYFGYFLVIAFYLVLDLSGEIGIDHNLFVFGSDPGMVYSDMNRYGHFLLPFTWFKVYWSFLVIVLAFLSNLLWVRGEDTGWRKRARLARQRLSPATVSGLAVGAIAFLLCGGFIWYNTTVVNTFRTSNETEELQAEYERQYKELDRLVVPGVVAMNVEVDIHPEVRSIQARGSYTLVNVGTEPIDSLVIDYRGGVVDIVSLSFDRATQELIRDEPNGLLLHRFYQPLLAGDTTVLAFEIDYENHGFTNNTGRTEIVRNGTFINGGQFMPSLGYDKGSELTDENARRRLGLPERERAAAVDDSIARRRTSIGSSTWTTFDAIVSTVPDQIAIAPGVLEREWQENGRRYFQYSTRGARIHPFVSFISADYVVARDSWRDVTLEVYHHPGHEYNVERFMNGMKRALDYYSASFGPYQFQVARIIEFPRYASFAQAFPNTMPYSEAIGFIAKVEEDDPESIDYPFFVTAHEMAHQWWGHQVAPADVQGSTMLTESLAEYSALKVLEHEYGPEKMRRFLEEELNGYLAGRQNETKKETPLLLVEGQGYIRYQKGSLVLYALSDYIGEDVLNGALAEYVRQVKFQEAPFTNSLELLDRLVAVTPDSLRYFIQDAIETITLYDLRASDATARRTADGRYEVTIDIDVAKMRSDSLGAETPVAVNDWIDIGVFADNEMTEPLYLHKHRLTEGATSVTVIVDGEPVRAGVDPWHKLIDRETGDNTARVTSDDAAGG